MSIQSANSLKAQLPASLDDLEKELAKYQSEVSADEAEKIWSTVDGLDPALLAFANDKTFSGQDIDPRVRLFAAFARLAKEARGLSPLTFTNNCSEALAKLRAADEGKLDALYKAIVDGVMPSREELRTQLDDGRSLAPGARELTVVDLGDPFQSVADLRRSAFEIRAALPDLDEEIGAKPLANASAARLSPKSTPIASLRKETRDTFVVVRSDQHSPSQLVGLQEYSLASLQLLREAVVRHVGLDPTLPRDAMIAAVQRGEKDIKLNPDTQELVGQIDAAIEAKTSALDAKIDAAQDSIGTLTFAVGWVARDDLVERMAGVGVLKQVPIDPETDEAWLERFELKGEKRGLLIRAKPDRVEIHSRRRDGGEMTTQHVVLSNGKLLNESWGASSGKDSRGPGRPDDRGPDLIFGYRDQLKTLPAHVRRHLGAHWGVNSD